MDEMRFLNLYFVCSTLARGESTDRRPPGDNIQ